MQKPLLSCLAVFSIVGALSAKPLKVDPEASSAVVEVKATGHSFTVDLTDYEAAISLKEDGSVEAARFTFSPNHLDSDSKKRDRKMLEWIEVESFPKIGFQLMEVRDGNVAVGNLTMHGQTRQVTFPFEVERSGKLVKISGSAVVDHREFGLEVITLMFFKVKPELQFEFSLVGALED